MLTAVTYNDEDSDLMNFPQNKNFKVMDYLKDGKNIHNCFYLYLLLFSTVYSVFNK